MLHVPKRELKDRARPRKAEFPRHDRAWWRAEARRTATDWESIIAQHLDVLRRLRLRHDPDVGGRA